MPQRSSLIRLPPEIKEVIAVLREQGRTLDEIREKLLELNTDVPRSTLGRYVQNIEKVSERVQKWQHISAALIKRFGTVDDDKTVWLIYEMIYARIADMLVALEEFDPKAAMMASKALDHLSRAKHYTTQTIEKARKAGIDDAVKAMHKAGKQKGLSPEALKEMEAAMGLIR